ncbi:MAG: hypothetical protein GC202_02235 [Alphaproteobacteria bacterium]|nr:hypothetical protein [Alphaproteobacteria bacterium]
MVDRPIIFSGPMVRALLEGRKTQTRRILKPQPPKWATFCQQLQALYLNRGWAPSGLWQWCEPETTPLRWLRRWPVHEKGPMKGTDYGLQPPYAPGDRLYVRETWRTRAKFDEMAPRDIKHGELVSYDADYQQEPNDGCRGKTRVAIHMPRWASRLTLIVEAVKVERLQDISDADAKAEGARVLPLQDENDPSSWWEIEPGVHQGRCPRAAFRLLWDSLNGKPRKVKGDKPAPDLSWKANPWLVAVSFRVVNGNINQLDTPSPAARVFP